MWSGTNTDMCVSQYTDLTRNGATHTNKGIQQVCVAQHWNIMPHIPNVKYTDAVRNIYKERKISWKLSLSNNMEMNQERESARVVNGIRQSCQTMEVVPVDGWASSGAAVQPDAVKSESSVGCVLMTRNLSFSWVSLQRLLWGRVPPFLGWLTVLVSNLLCCLSGIPNCCSLFLGSSYYACRRICI